MMMLTRSQCFECRVEDALSDPRLNGATI
jgi:hypothetical protein